MGRKWQLLLTATTDAPHDLQELRDIWGIVEESLILSAGPAVAPESALAWMPALLPCTAGRASSCLFCPSSSPSHTSSTASGSLPFPWCAMQPTLLLKRRDRLPF